MTAVDKFNALDGRTVTRDELEEIIVIGANQGQKTIAERIQAILDQHEDPEFQITVGKTAIDTVPEECLPGMECMEPDEEFTGLEKAVSPDEIYQYITDLMLNTIKEVGHLPWQKEWKESSLSNGSEALNWKTKKKYRGINYFLLNFEEKMVNGKIVMMPRKFKNSYFLTFNQIKEAKGELKKGSKGTKIVYFTRLYRYEQAEPELSFGTYSFPKMVNWLKKNRSKISLLNSFSPESIASQNAIPILKYYNVFSAEDVEGVEWNIQEPPKRTETEKIESADAIVKSMQKAPPINHGGGRAYYIPSADFIQMPNKEDFNKVQSYYATLFHEMVHSTGHHKRLDRDMKGGKGTKGYAFEELIAEMGAVYLCAESGILFETRDNSAKYLKGWNSRLVKNMENDNRFFFRAASQAQAASDFVLDRDKEGNPAYQNSLKSELETKKVAPPKKKPTTKKKAKVGEQLGLFGSKGEIKINSDDFKDMNVSELRKFTLAYYHDRLKGKKTAIKNSLKKVEFVSKSGRKLLKPMYKEKAAIMEHLEEIIKNSTYNNWGDRKKTDNPTILGYLNFKSKANIDGEKRHVRIAISVNEKRETFFKSADVGKKKKSGKTPGVRFRNPNDGGIQPLSKNKDNKKNDKGLNAPWHKPGTVEREALDNCGRLEKGYKYTKGGKIRKVNKKKITPKAKPEKQKTGTERLKIFQKKDDAVKLTTAQRKQARKEWNQLKNPVKWETFLEDYGKKKNEESDLVSRVFSGTMPDALTKSLPKAKDKKKTNNPKKGLKSPVEPKPVATVEPQTVKPVQPETVPGTVPVQQPVPEPEPVHGNPNSLAARMQRNKNRTIEYYTIDNPDMAKFLGQVEIKNEESVGISITAPQGAGKTRFAFQLINAFAKNYKVGHASMEEHPDSSLYTGKAAQYIDPENFSNIDTPDIKTMDDIEKLIQNNDVIVIDSFEKLREIDKNIQVDQNFRKKYDGKLFVFIFQLTSDGKMRGGSKSQFDVDIVLFTEKFDDYRENYIYPDKNRYNSEPNLKFNIYTGKLEGEKPEPEEIPPEIKPKPIGRLIATPIN